MVNAQRLGKKISKMFNFIYEVGGEYYVMGRDAFEKCGEGTENRYYYEGYLDSLQCGEEGRILFQYERVRSCAKCGRGKDGERDGRIEGFVKGLGWKELEALARQAELAVEYDCIAYGRK